MEYTMFSEIVLDKTNDIFNFPLTFGISLTTNPKG
ncbi:hypothetical protein L288_03870 [Sphingobium quisquiliarum P25]|uniref:Uncharacterized protein n=1 Tax=Sphingobium quisquiliarum P25 TaxID=1329909 RepID=T0HED7_9SPHN|nr:hypothetical protein L288_03870 [Sphingobium quisquiliarum P25]